MVSSREKVVLRKATAHLDYARQEYLEGRQRGRISWETKLGEFIVYAGIAYKGHSKNYITGEEEKVLARRLHWGLLATRRGWSGQVKAITLYDLKQLMEGPMGEVYPKDLDQKAERYLNRILKKYGLEPIVSEKPWNRREDLESKTAENYSES